jgi:hypothetical protein
MLLGGKMTDREPVITNFAIGDVGPAGGHIFYDKGEFSDGWRYMEAAPENCEFNAQWSSFEHDIFGTQTTIGSGKRNTELIIRKLNQCGETFKAAQICCNNVNSYGFTDWFLPNKDELNLMYENLHKRGIGRFGQGDNENSIMNWCYWTSSQDDKFYAWVQFFDNGKQYCNYEFDLHCRVRPIRFF